MLHRSFASFSPLLSWCLLSAVTPLGAQELLPLELAALAARANSDPVAAAANFVSLARETAATQGDAQQSARLEAWALQAARLARATNDRTVLTALDALSTSAAAQHDPVLADRLRLAALELAETLPLSDADHRANALGFLRAGWLIGPFANERGSGFATALPPETTFDLTAELPGKQRPVRWRSLPPRALSPTWPLARIVHPHEQSLVYLAFGVHAEQATTAVLELGSTGSWVVFCNGTRVGGREVERAFAHDQDAASLSLLAGDNLLLLKLCHQEGADFLASARLRGLDGQPLAGVRAANESAAMERAAAPRAAAGTPTATFSLGGRSTWTIGEAHGADTLRLAWLWRAREADGNRDRRDAAAAAAATKALPEQAESWLVLAATKVSYGRSAADRDENERRRALEAAIAKAPDHVEAKVQLGYLLRDSSNLWRQARGLADEALALQPQSLSAIGLHATTLRDEGLDELADAELLRAATTIPRAELWRTAARHLADREPRAALPFYERLAKVTVSESDRVAAAMHAARTGNADAAIAQLRAAIADDPFTGNAHRSLAELLAARGEFAAAIALLESWLALAPDDANAMVQAARYWRHLRSRDATAQEHQLELLRSALQVEPTRRDDERHAEFVASDMVGLAATETNSFHTPYQVDAAALLKADAGPLADAETARDPLHWLLRQEVVRANRNGTTNVYRHDVVRVLTEQGARSLQNYQLPSYRGEQRARLLACTVFRRDGAVQRPTLQGARVRLPDLRPGDVVAVEGRIDDLAPSFFGDYFGLVHTFGSPEGSPVRSDELIVLAAPGRDYHSQSVQGAPEPERDTLADGTRRFRFQLRELPRDRPEIRRPRATELEPTVRLSTYRDWDQFAAWWWNLIKNQLEVTPAMQQTVRERCAGLTTDEAKIAALYHFVTTDVRYEAWEFGVHGYKPYSTAIIHERRHGDCKDKTLLLCALLGEIGIACRPVLIFADPLRSRDDLALPMVQHFNHCIAWLPATGERPGRFLDGTATWHPTDTLPDMDQGAQVLIVHQGRAELRTVPLATPETNVDRRSWVIDLLADGTATLRLAQQPLGNFAVDLRANLATEPARLRESGERQLARTFGRVTLRELEPSPTTNPEAPVHLTTTASLPEIGQRDAARWQLPSAWVEDHLLTLTAESARHSPLLLGAPSGTMHTLRYNLPAGYRPGELPADVAHEAPFGHFTMQWRHVGDAVVIERRLALTTPRIEAAQHSSFRDFSAAVKAADSQLVLLQKEGGR